VIARDDAPFTLWREELPRWLERTHLTLRPGESRSCAEPAFRRALVVVEVGTVVVVGRSGREIPLGEGAVFTVSDLSSARLHNRDRRLALLSLGRRGATNVASAN
jgi:hypothetical protein